ncbi:tripartite tricarboxylate transporter substrate binding protein [Ruegeria meonggei]|uniref:tripartite tricarboxylate transporter substrate binding protein n=1 Tax=Ruegeria meonggei TaxID=1446476 RepID=UPI003672B5DD
MQLKPIAAAVILGAATGALADYPEKPVQFIVPWPPGGAEDILTRFIADEFQEMYGVPAAVVNKPGGGGGPFPGAIEVSTAAPDGYTIGSFVIDVPVVGPDLGIPELQPNPFDAVGTFMTYPFLIVAAEDAPYDTMQELAAHAQQNEVVLGHFGSALIPTRVTVELADTMGFEFGADAAFDNVDCNVLASGDVEVMNSIVSLVLPCLDELKVLATLTEERLPILPDVPTVKELAPELDIVLWNGLFVPKDTPDEVVTKIEAAVQSALEKQELIDYVAENGTPVYWRDRSATDARITKDSKTYADIAIE